MLHAIDHALGRTGASPSPLQTGLTSAERDQRLRAALCFPERDLPSAELAQWAVALLEIDKEASVRAAAAAIAAAEQCVPQDDANSEFIARVLDAVCGWLASPQTVDDLRRLGALWWTVVRNPPSTVDGPLADAASMAWWLAGYDPEGWGDPPTEDEELQPWLSQAADNRGGIVDVLTLVQRALGSNGAHSVLQSVRDAVAAWRAGSP